MVALKCGFKHLTFGKIHDKLDVSSVVIEVFCWQIHPNISPKIVLVCADFCAIKTVALAEDTSCDETYAHKVAGACGEGRIGCVMEMWLPLRNAKQGSIL